MKYSKNKTPAFPSSSVGKFPPRCEEESATPAALFSRYVAADTGTRITT
jgi:hypothetical protein